MSPHEAVQIIKETMPSGATMWEFDMHDFIGCDETMTFVDYMKVLLPGTEFRMAERDDRDSLVVTVRPRR